MSVVVPKWRFTEAMVQDAPDFRGVYVLWADGAVEYIRLKHLT